jgi:signal transduction histidine kinase
MNRPFDHNYLLPENSNEVSIRESIEVDDALVPHEIEAWDRNPEQRYSRQELQRILFDERLAERTRMARDLHDTLLQTIQGSKLVADDALDSSTDPIRMRRAMEQLSVCLATAMQEGRSALNSLRTTTTQTNDLAEALRRVTEDGLIPSSMAVTFSVVGDAREMHAIVRDEIYRIGCEAIRNACTHSGASQLEVELRYANDLALRVSDNGIGIDPITADRGKDGHFGLQGMRERASRIGGKLTLGSSSGSGTEISLIVSWGHHLPEADDVLMYTTSTIGSTKFSKPDRTSLVRQRKTNKTL